MNVHHPSYFDALYSHKKLVFLTTLLLFFCRIFVLTPLVAKQAYVNESGTYSTIDYPEEQPDITTVYKGLNALRLTIAAEEQWLNNPQKTPIPLLTQVLTREEYQQLNRCYSLPEATARALYETCCEKLAHIEHLPSPQKRKSLMIFDPSFPENPSLQWYTQIYQALNNIPEKPIQSWSETAVRISTRTLIEYMYAAFTQQAKEKKPSLPSSLLALGGKISLLSTFDSFVEDEKRSSAQSWAELLTPIALAQLGVVWNQKKSLSQKTLSILEPLLARALLVRFYQKPKTTIYTLSSIIVFFYTFVRTPQAGEVWKQGKKLLRPETIGSTISKVLVQGTITLLIKDFFPTLYGMLERRLYKKHGHPALRGGLQRFVRDALDIVIKQKTSLFSVA